MKKTPLSLAILTALATSPLISLQAKAEEATQLKQVVVTANNTEQSAHSVTSNMTVITAEEIKEKHYRTLGDALKSVPGIQIVRNGGLGTTTSIIMRGQSNKSTLILINGVEMTNPMGTGGAIVTQLLLSHVERIEVIQGAQSGIWGANASAGVINIITQQAKKNGTQGTVNVEAGSNRYTKLAAQISSKNQQGDFSFGFSEINTDGFSAIKLAGHNASEYEDDGFRQNDFTLNMGINITKQHRLEFLIKETNSTTNYDYTTNPDQVVSANYKNDLKRIQYLYKVQNFNSTLYLSENKLSQYNDAMIDNIGLKGSYTYQPNQSLAFVLENKKYINEANSNNYDNTAVGLTNTNQFNRKNLIITESIRSDQYSTFKGKVTGKVGIKNYFTKQIALSANYGTAYNAPTLFQSTYNATSNLNPEETEAFDINLDFFGLSASYYQTSTKNLINYGGSYPNDYYENLTGTSKFEGIELAYHKMIPAIDTDVQLTYSQGTAKDDNGKWLARRAENTAGLNLTYDGFNKITLISATRYQGKTYDKADQKGANIGNYFVTNFTLNYEANSNLTLYANIINVFDEDYTNAVASYQTDNVTPKYVYSNGGRQFFAGIQGKF